MGHKGKQLINDCTSLCKLFEEDISMCDIYVCLMTRTDVFRVTIYYMTYVMITYKIVYLLYTSCHLYLSNTLYTLFFFSLLTYTAKQRPHLKSANHLDIGQFASIRCLLSISWPGETAHFNFRMLNRRAISITPVSSVVYTIP